MVIYVLDYQYSAQIQTSALSKEAPRALSLHHLFVGGMLNQSYPIMILPVPQLA